MCVSEHSSDANANPANYYYYLDDTSRYCLPTLQNSQSYQDDAKTIVESIFYYLDRLGKKFAAWLLRAKTVLQTTKQSLDTGGIHFSQVLTTM